MILKFGCCSWARTSVALQVLAEQDSPNLTESCVVTFEFIHEPGQFLEEREREVAAHAFAAHAFAARAFAVHPTYNRHESAFRETLCVTIYFNQVGIPRRLRYCFPEPCAVEMLSR